MVHSSAGPTPRPLIRCPNKLTRFVTQYHYVSQLAPDNVRKPLSYITGWILVLAWIADLASCAYLAGTIIQGLAVLNYPGYDFQRWHVRVTT